MQKPSAKCEGVKETALRLLPVETTKTDASGLFTLNGDGAE